LQQNAFDKVDAASGKERQKYVFNIVKRVLDTNFRLDDKEKARGFFNRLRQLFIDWNYNAMDSSEFKQQEESIDKLIKEYSGNEESL
jgi:V/A-type H+-transporting ATPase subunit A